MGVSDLIEFDTRYRYERVVLKSSVAFNVAGGGFATSTVTIDHDLGYKPYYKAWYTFGSGKIFQLFSGTASFSIDGNSAQVEGIDVTTTQLSFTIANYGAGAISGTIYYRIYAEEQD